MTLINFDPMVEPHSVRGTVRPFEVKARHTDPESSQEAAENQWGIRGGYKGLSDRIAAVLTHRPQTFKEIHRAIWPAIQPMSRKELDDACNDWNHISDVASKMRGVERIEGGRLLMFRWEV